MGREILVGERNWETVECRRVHSSGLTVDCMRVHSGELHGEWCRLDVTGGLKGKGDIGG